MKRLLTITLLFLLTLFLLPAGLLLLAPDSLLKSAANYYLLNYQSDLEAEIVSLEGVLIRPNAVRVGSLQLRSPGYQVRASELHFDYRLEGLRNLSLGNLELSQLEIVELAENMERGGVDSDPQEGAASLADMLGLLRELPFEALQLDAFTARVAGQEFSGDVTISQANSALDLRLTSSAYSDFEFLLGGEFSSSQSLSWKASIHQQGANIATAGIDLRWEEGIFSLDSESQLSLTALRTIPAVQEVLGDVVLFNDRIELAAEAWFPDPLQATLSSIQIDYSLSLDGPAQTLHVAKPADNGGQTLQLTLPLSVSGTLDRSSALLSSNFSPTYATLSDTSSDHAFHLELNLDEVDAQCTLPFLSLPQGNANYSGDLIRCALEADVAGSMPSIEIQGLSAIGTSLAGSMQVEFLSSDDDTTLSATLPSLVVNAREIVAEEITASIGLSLEEIELELLPSLGASTNWRMTSSELDLGEWELNAPMAQGQIALGGDNVSTQLSVGLKNGELANLTVEHDLEGGLGAMQLTMPALAFDNINPLSAYITEMPYELELIAGQISADARVEWLLGDADPILSGYGDMRFAGLDGSFDETFFVGFDSELETVLVDGGNRLVSPTPSSANIALLDIGLPLEESRWNYRLEYDRATEQYQLEVQDFSTQVLGGQASVAAVGIDSLSENSLRDGQIDLILAGLNVTSIIGLADYPGVYADGFISGYLPIIIADGVFTVKDGLIGALQPGGLIRYTPASATPSSNSTMQLLNDALSNYQYKILNNNVIYEPNGDLTMAVELKGANPDMNGGQEINLNINISDNIPQLLESLQASREISDALEAAAGNRR